MKFLRIKKPDSEKGESGGASKKPSRGSVWIKWAFVFAAIALSGYLFLDRDKGPSRLAGAISFYTDMDSEQRSLIRAARRAFPNHRRILLWPREIFIYGPDRPRPEDFPERISLWVNIDDDDEERLSGRFPTFELETEAGSVEYRIHWLRLPEVSDPEIRACTIYYRLSGWNRIAILEYWEPPTNDADPRVMADLEERMKGMMLRHVAEL